MKAIFAVLLAVAILALGCGSRNEESVSETSPSTSHSTDTPALDIVGRWQRVLTCSELANELGKVGLGSLAPYTWQGQTSSTGKDSFAPGSPHPTAVHPCVGALPREHSHFFDASGQFGSLDWLGGQVDDGTYVRTDDRTIQIGKVAFHYRIVKHDSLFLHPVVTRAMVHEALAHPKKFSDAFWAVMVADAGHPWKRIPCGSWC